MNTRITRAIAVLPALYILSGACVPAEEEPIEFRAPVPPPSQPPGPAPSCLAGFTKSQSPNDYWNCTYVTKQPYGSRNEKADGSWCENDISGLAHTIHCRAAYDIHLDPDVSYGQSCLSTNYKAFECYRKTNTVIAHTSDIVRPGACPEAHVVTNVCQADYWNNGGPANGQAALADPANTPSRNGVPMWRATCTPAPLGTCSAKYQVVKKVFFDTNSDELVEYEAVECPVEANNCTNGAEPHRAPDTNTKTCSCSCKVDYTQGFHRYPPPPCAEANATGGEESGDVYGAESSESGADPFPGETPSCDLGADACGV